MLTSERPASESGSRTAGEIITGVEQSAAAQGIDIDPEQREFLTEAADYLAGDRDDISGIYLYGSAGRGKTWLMSEIFRAAPADETSKRRVHFHTFFRELQQRFGALVSTRTAIEETVEDLLRGTDLLFFDEFHVHDPGGASLLNRLLAAIVERGVPTLVTSNYAPEDLLPNRVYHHVFEPGIRTIRDRFAVRVLDGTTDYRRDERSHAERFASGRWIAARTDDEIRDRGLLPPTAGERISLLPDHRAVSARAARGSEVWFDFDELLEARPTSQDFLELADRFDSWVLSGVPRLSRASRAARQRFVTLLDVLVDSDRRLTVVSETDREHLVDIEDPPADLFRAESRLALLGAD